VSAASAAAVAGHAAPDAGSAAVAAPNGCVSTVHGGVACVQERATLFLPTLALPRVTGGAIGSLLDPLAPSLPVGSLLTEGTAHPGLPIAYERIGDFSGDGPVVVLTPGAFDGALRRRERQLPPGCRV
jgi:hypothetical protein